MFITCNLQVLHVMGLALLVLGTTI